VSLKPIEDFISACPRKTEEGTPMTTFVALLRGINVGGKNKIPMADLRQLCERLDFGNVQTYIKSGNVVFTEKPKAPEIYGLPVDCNVRFRRSTS
jgi:hypothetical protein